MYIFRSSGLASRRRLQVTSNVRLHGNAVDLLTTKASGMQSAFSSLATSDPISSATDEKRRNLLLSASLTLLVVVFGVRVDRLSWVEVTVPASSPDLLLGCLAIAVSYTFVSYFTNLWTEIHRWFLARTLVVVAGTSSYVTQHMLQVSEVEGLISKIHSPSFSPDEQERATQEVKSVLKKLAKIDSQVAATRKLAQVLTGIQWLKLCILDISAPLALGTAALVKSVHSVIPLVSALLV